MIMKRLRLGFMLGLATLEKQLAELLSAYKDLETGQRGLMIAGQQQFLAVGAMLET